MRTLARSWLVFALALALVTGCGGPEKKPVKKPKKKKGKAAQVYEQGVKAEAAGKPTLAIKKYRRAIKMRPKHFETVDKLAHLLIAEKRQPEAVEVAKDYSNQVAGDPRGFHLYAETQISAKLLKGALETLTMILELDEEDAASWEKRCKVQLMLEKFAEAIPDCRKAVQLKDGEAEFLITLGSALHQAGQLDEAALNLRSAIQIAPEHPRAHLLLGVVLRDSFEVREALSNHLKAVRFDPEYERGYFELGVTQNRLGDNLGAEASLAKAVELNPKDATNWYAYGEILRALKKWDEAVPAYRKAIEIEPDHPKAHVKLGYVLFYKGDLGEAEVVLTAALRAHPDDPYAYYNLGFVYAKAQKYKLGIESLEKFIELAPKGDGEIPKAKTEIRKLKWKLKKSR